MGNSFFSSRVARAAVFALLTGASSLALSASPASAQVAGADLQTIQSAVKTALANAQVPSGATQAQIDAIYAAALSTVTQSLISQLSGDGPQSVAEAIMTAASSDGASDTAIGDGLADAALAENTTTGTEIADALAATGTAGQISSFQTTANATGTAYGKSLADNAGSTGQIGAGPGGSGGGGGVVTIGGGLGGGGGGGGGCTNPSCT